MARTIGVSLARLTAKQRERYLELAVFGEDVAIPCSVLGRYWQATGGWSPFQTRRYCQRLAGLSLQPSGSLAATLATRLRNDGATHAIADGLEALPTTPHLRAIAALPDLPHPALSRVLIGHMGGMAALVAAPDGSWLASADTDGVVRVWDPVTGTGGHTP